MTTDDAPTERARRREWNRWQWSRWQSRRPLPVAVAAAGVLLAGTVVGLTTGGTTGQSGHAPAAAAPVPVPVVDVAGEGADGRIPWSAPLTVTAEDGELVEVAVTAVDDIRLPGALLDGGTWRSTDTLLPDAPYSVLARVRDAAGRERWQPVVATTAVAERTLGAALSPGDDAVVGVGQPVVVRLDRAVDDPAARARLAERLEVTSTPAVEGAWRWMNGEELHYRPATYWPAGTRVEVRADLDRLSLPDGVWGSGVRTSAFTVGDALVSTVDVAAHTMTVTRNGEVLRVLPASMGKPEFPTRSGVHLVLEKEASKVMNSDTVGLPGEYRTKVDWAVRLTYSGTFTHSAPWSVDDQGVRNVSHGCINLSPADARWFYDLVRRGDVVEVVNSPAGPKLSDPGAADWNLSFDDWKEPAPA